MPNSLQGIYKYCVEHNELPFLFEAKGNQLVAKLETPIKVNIDSTFEYIEAEETDIFLPLYFKICHDGANKNETSITLDLLKARKDSIKNKPVVCEIVTKSDGTQDFGHHAISYYLDDKGVKQAYYNEHVVGVFPETCNPHLVLDSKTGRTYLYAMAYIYKKHGNEAAKILKAKHGSKVSAELSIYELGYDTVTKTLAILDFEFSAVALLGDDVEQGMYDTTSLLSPFNEPQDKVYSLQQLQEQTAELAEKVNQAIMLFQQNKKGETQSMKLDELLKKYNKARSDINFEIEGKSDAELEKLFEEAFANESATIPTPSEPNEPATAEPVTSATNDGVNTEPTATTDNVSTYSLSISEKVGDKVKNYEVSLSDRARSVRQIVRAQYESEDNYIDVECYDNYVVMRDYEANTYYRQAYKMENDTPQLVGDREIVYASFITKAEKDALDKLKNDYELVKKKLANYESRKDKLDYLNGDVVYSKLIDESHFKSLIENIDKYSLEEFKTQCDVAYAKLVRESGNFEAKNTGHKTIPIPMETKTESNDAYGGLFAED